MAQSRDSKEYYRVYQQWRTSSNLVETDSIETTELQTYEEEIPRYIDQREYILLKVIFLK